MGKFTIHSHGSPEEREAERAQHFADLPFKDKLERLFAIIDLSIKMNGGRPIKQPQGKGIIIRKPAR